MQLKRYTNKELITIFTDVFYDYMASQKKDNPKETNAVAVKESYEEKIALYTNRANVYVEKLNKRDLNPSCEASLREQLEYLGNALSYLNNSNMLFQKELYKKSKKTDYCRSIIRIPLDKLINSYYDDLILEVLFYDDVCTPKGFYNQYSCLIDKEDRIEFLKKHTEITHMGLIYAPNNQIKAVIGVQGKLNFQNPRVSEGNITLLPSKFSDFKNLTLKDTSEIRNNNDLKQFIQSKIDLDKENMEKLSSLNIRGDIYEIYLSPYKDDNYYSKDVYYIRYVCRSTGRVYYNELNLNNLKLSKEFKKDDYDSYSRAWWELNTLGGKVDGKPVIRC